MVSGSRALCGSTGPPRASLMLNMIRHVRILRAHRSGDAGASIAPLRRVGARVAVLSCYERSDRHDRTYSRPAPRHRPHHRPPAPPAQPPHRLVAPARPRDDADGRRSDLADLSDRRRATGASRSPSMPGVERLSVDEAVREAERAREARNPGDRALSLFTEPSRRDPLGSKPSIPKTSSARACRAIKAAVPEIGV